MKLGEITIRKAIDTCKEYCQTTVYGDVCVGCPFDRPEETGFSCVNPVDTSPIYDGSEEDKITIRQAIEHCKNYCRPTIYGYICDGCPFDKLAEDGIWCTNPVSTSPLYNLDEEIDI